MRARRIIASIPVPDVDAGRSFYADYLGFGEEFDLGWVARYASPDRPIPGRISGI